MSKWQRLYVVEYRSRSGWCIYGPFPTLRDARVAKAKAEWEKGLTHEFRIVKYTPEVKR